MKQITNRLWALVLMGAMGSMLIMPTADARLIFTTEDDAGMDAATYYLNQDADSTEDATLSFGNDLLSTLQWDASASTFILSQPLEMGGIIDMNGNEITNLIVDNESTSPSPCAPGQMYYDTDLGGSLHYCDGSLAWIELSTGSVSAGSIGTTELADGSVTTIKIADANVTTAKIADANITEAKLATGAVTAVKLAANAVTTDKILDANVTAAKLAANAVTTDKILDANVTAAKLATDAVTTAKIADDNVTAAKLAADTAGAGLVQNGTTGALDVGDGTGITVNANDIAVNVDGTTIEINGSDQLGIIEGGVTFTETEDRTVAVSITPEFQNYTLSAGTSGTNTGTMYADYDATVGEERNYYEWSAKAPTTLQDYSIVLQWALPENFKSFVAGTSEIEIDYMTDKITTADNRIDIEMLDTTGTTITFGSTTNVGLVSTSAGVWEDDYALDLTNGTFTAGEYMTMIIKMSSRSEDVARIGEIKFNMIVD